MMDDILFAPPGTFRTIFLFVGQGDSTLLIIPDGDKHKYVLIDSNIDEENGGVDLANLMKNKVPKNKLIFINTHPHKDHVEGIEEIHGAVVAGEIWHSGHLPHKDDRDAYKKMQNIISKIGSKNEYYLRGSRDKNVIHTDKEETSKVVKKIGDADFQVLSPAKYVSDDIDGEDQEKRRKRIHEQCGVLKITYLGKSIMITGDSDKEAWAEHITDYHRDNLKAEVLSASHHGSRSFFKNGEEDSEPYKEHIEAISPEYLIISAPKKSRHGHPHNDAMEIYKEYIDDENIFNLGDKEQSLIIDIDAKGVLQKPYWVNINHKNPRKDEDKKIEMPNIIQSPKNEFVPAIKGGGWCL